MTGLDPPNFLRYLAGCAVLIVTVILPGILIARKKKPAYRRMLDSTYPYSFLTGLCLGAVLVAGYVSLQKNSQVSKDFQTDSPPERRSGDHDVTVDLRDEVIKEHLSRNILFFSSEGCSTLFRSHVVVIGLGGVGSHAAHLLLRSGVGKLSLVDFDQVTLSSLNRHAVATRADIGLPKATVLAQHFHNIFPEIEVDARVAMYTAETEESILGGPVAPDYVLDAIDNIDTKVHLLAACNKRSIPVLCVGGAGAKADPTRLRFVDLVDASMDPLVRTVRHQLRTKFNVTTGIDCLLSMEKPRCGLVTTEEQAAAPSMLDYQVIPNFRVRTIPVLGTSPAVFGMAAASWILCKLGKQPYLPEPVFQMRRGQYETILETLHDDDMKLLGHCDDIHVDLEEVTFLVSSVWRGLSASRLGCGDNKDKGLHRRTAGLKLVRFDSMKPASPGNLMLLSEEEADEFQEDGLEKWQKKYPKISHYAATNLQIVRGIFGEFA